MFAIGLDFATACPCTTEIDALVKKSCREGRGNRPNRRRRGSDTLGRKLPSEHLPRRHEPGDAGGGKYRPRTCVEKQQVSRLERKGGEDSRRASRDGAMSGAVQGEMVLGTVCQYPLTVATSGSHPKPSVTFEWVLTMLSEASLALGQARALDQQGKEAECMEAIAMGRNSST